MSNYEEAMSEFRKVSAAHRAVVAQYHVRQVGDAEFLASKAKLEAAGAAVDAAEAELAKGAE